MEGVPQRVRTLETTKGDIIDMYIFIFLIIYVSALSLSA